MTKTPVRRAIVTCGPAYAPIDEVRRITNHSTGRLGCVLSNRLARAGWDVICLKGVAATYSEPMEPGVDLVGFSTNDDLLDRWRAVEDKESIAAVFHAAALTDFKVKEVSSATGEELDPHKISSRAGELTVTLAPATKLIGELRPLFPSARLAGWKYELSGTREDALGKGERQLTENRTDACIVNGRAYGDGFGVVRPGETLVDLPSVEALCEWLVGWAGE